MKIVFMGTPEYAVASLQKLNESHHEVVAVVTVPDKPAGRGRKLRPSAVKQYATEHGLKVLQPAKLKDEQFLEELESLKAELFAVVAFRMLPQQVWDMPAKGTINLHGSLLPNYRGAAPINWAIINDEAVSGATTFFINENIDTGDLIMKRELAVSKEDTAGSYHDKLMVVGAELLLETVDAIEEGTAPRIPQKVEGEIKQAPKIFKEHTHIDFSKNVNEVYNFIRGLSPYPAAYSILKQDGNEFSVKLLEAKPLVEEHSYPPGKVITEGKDQLKIAAKGGYIQILKLQIQGKKALKTRDLLNGFKFSESAHMS